MEKSPFKNKAEIGRIILVLASGFLLLLFLTKEDGLLAKPKKDIALSAADAYSLQAGLRVSNNSKVHNCHSPEKQSGVLEGPDGSWRYIEQWSWCKDGTNQVASVCYMHIKLTGTNKKVKISRVKNGMPCKRMPKRATFWPKSGKLRWGKH